MGRHPKDNPIDKRFTVACTYLEREKFTSYAEEKGVSLSELSRAALHYYVNKSMKPRK